MKLSDQSRDRAMYVCQHVFDRSRSMDYVHYDRDGEILITCSGDDHNFHDPAQVRVVGLGHLLSRDATLSHVPDLLKGAWADRVDQQQPWRDYNNNA